MVYYSRFYLLDGPWVAAMSILEVGMARRLGCEGIRGSAVGLEDQVADLVVLVRVICAKVRRSYSRLIDQNR